MKVKNTVFGPSYEDGSGERYIVEYASNHTDHKGVDQGPRLKISQFSDDSIYIEGPFIEGFLEAIKKVMTHD